MFARTDQIQFLDCHISFCWQIGSDHSPGVNSANAVDRIVVGRSWPIQNIAQTGSNAFLGFASFNQRHLRRDRAVRPEFPNQTIVIRLLAHTGIFSAIFELASPVIILSTAIRPISCSSDRNYFRWPSHSRDLGYRRCISKGKSSVSVASPDFY